MFLAWFPSKCSLSRSISSSSIRIEPTRTFRQVSSGARMLLHLQVSLCRAAATPILPVP